MKNKYRRLLVGLSLIIATSPAVQADPIPLFRSTQVEVGPCSTANHDPELGIATQHVNAIKTLILRANQVALPQEFEAICAGVSRNGRRAYAQSYTRSFFLEGDLVLRVQNDAQLAWTIAHEMAHITLRHFMDATPVTGRAGEEIRALARQNFQALRRLFEESIEGNKSEGEQSERAAELQSLLQRISALERSQLTQDEQANWVEVEADQVALYLYLNAGFSAQELAWRAEQLVIATAAGLDPHSPPSPHSAAERRALAQSLCQLPQMPARGSLRYAAPCWTLWNTNRAIQADPNLQTRVQRNTILNLNNSEAALHAAQAEIRHAQAVQESPK